MNNKTFAMIKPEAVLGNLTGKIIDIIESKGFEIIAIDKKKLTKEEAEEFYGVHKNRPFFKDLIDYISSGPVVLLVLMKDGAVLNWRNLMGATNPSEAKEGTIRSLYGKSIGENAVHGSDSDENAKIEIEFFFPKLKEAEVSCN